MVLLAVHLTLQAPSSRWCTACLSNVADGDFFRVFSTKFALLLKLQRLAKTRLTFSPNTPLSMCPHVDTAAVRSVPAAIWFKKKINCIHACETIAVCLTLKIRGHKCIRALARIHHCQTPAQRGVIYSSTVLLHHLHIYALQVGLCRSLALALVPPPHARASSSKTSYQISLDTA